MKRYLAIDEWKIIERDWDPQNLRVSESIFSLGNGRMGLRGNFEEGYDGNSLQGTYFAGIYYPDKTKVGWWKNGYPEYFAKVLNATNWIYTPLSWNGHPIDLAHLDPTSYEQVLDMREGTLKRTFSVDLPDGSSLSLNILRFCSMTRKEAGLTRITIKVENGKGELLVRPGLDLHVRNEDANYEEVFWDRIEEDANPKFPFVHGKTKKSGFGLLSSLHVEHTLNGIPLADKWQRSSSDLLVQLEDRITMHQGDTYEITKYTAHVNSLYAHENEFNAIANSLLEEWQGMGFEHLLKEHSDWWSSRWEDSDIEIAGDIEAQQAIRFNIFQLYQTYTGDDPRLNIGPKGFTGEKYGGSTYWDTEAYCLPFFLSSAPEEVSKNLLLYRYRHLEKAIENAEKLGFTNGAALYPMVTMNGEECHNEWEITFEEIHRNGAIAYAIYDFIRYTGNDSYLIEGGLEVLIGIARFWAQRVNWSEEKGKYVILGVTGPNEYENNVNNNWYTNYIARWCLQYTLASMGTVKKNYPEVWLDITEKASWRENEQDEWSSIIENIYLPEDPEMNIFLQQDGFLDKEIVPVADLPAEHRPINQKWSWDRILRSCYIKQADVLQGIYFFIDDFTEELVVQNFNFYEPLTVHESSLSPCVHSILASYLGRSEKAYEMYLRTSRLDLDDYNNDTEDGLHITSMAGTWMSIVKGFGGMMVVNDQLHLKPQLPKNWKSLSFSILFRGDKLKVNITRSGTEVVNFGDEQININLDGKLTELVPVSQTTV